MPAWQMPQGGIDPGESPRQAALRELKEEIGTDKAEIVCESQAWLQYDLPVELAGGIWGGRYRGQRQKWFVMRFTGSDADINLATEHPEFVDWQWVTSERLTDLIVPSNASSTWISWPNSVSIARPHHSLHTSLGRG